MMRILALLVLIPGIAVAAESATTFGPCSPLAPNNSGSITINCPGLSQEQGEQMLSILNKILAEKLDFDAVMRKLDEILHEVNPNAPKTTYTFEGDKRIISPGRSLVIAGEGEATFRRFVELEEAKDWKGLIELSEAQMKERPEWLTPYVCAGKAYLQMGQRDKALALVEYAEKRIAGNPDYGRLQKPLSEMLKILRGR